MKSRKRSSTANRRLKQQLEAPRFFLDRNIAGERLTKFLRKAGFDVTPHHELFDNDEEPDPWILYKCGKLGLTVIAADDRFRRTWTHVAAIKLGRTAVFCFTENNQGPALQSQALLRAQRRIWTKVATTQPPFFTCVYKDGTLRDLPKLPEPGFHRYMREADWESYQRAKDAENEYQRRQDQTERANGQTRTEAADIRRSHNGHSQDQARTEATEEKASGKEAGKE